MSRSFCGSQTVALYRTGPNRSGAGDKSCKGGTSLQNDIRLSNDIRSIHACVFDKACSFHGTGRDERTLRCSDFEIASASSTSGFQHGHLVSEQARIFAGNRSSPDQYPLCFRYLRRRGLLAEAASLHPGADLSLAAMADGKDQWTLDFARKY